MTLWHALAGTVAIVVITYAVAIWLLRKAFDNLGDLF
jgi:ABC-type spermidine/putrescine transport system permease subunit I